jgi:ATP-binding cassette, subfamily B, bacterial
MRIAQMTGWVSFTLMTIYANVGEVEDGMRTLTPPHALTDAPDAPDLGRVRGEIGLTRGLCLWPRSRRGQDIDLTIRAGRKAGHRRRLGRGQIHARGAAAAALRSEKGRC